MAKPMKRSLRDAGFPSTKIKVFVLSVFFLCGFVKMAVHDSILAGAEDILENTNYSTGWISAMVNIPYMFAVVVVQFLHHRLKNIYQIWFGCLAMILGSIGVGFLPDTTLQIAAVCFTGVGVACVELAMIALTIKYPDGVVQSFVIGEASGRLLTPIIYTVLTSHLCIKPSFVFTVISLSSIILPLQDYLLTSSLFDASKSAQYQMSKEKQPLCDDEGLDKNSLSDEETIDDDDPKVQDIKSSSLFVDLCLFYQSFSRFYAAFLGFAFMTLYSQSFITTIVFSNSPFKPREHYQYYLMALWSGAFAGRAFGFLFDCCGKITKLLFSINTVSYFHIVFNLCTTTVMFVALWCRNMPNVWVILLLCFISGILAGVGYLISLSPVSEKERHIEFTRMMAVTIKGSACVVAALISIPLESLIRQRCFEVTHTSQYCIARYIGIGKKPCYST